MNFITARKESVRRSTITLIEMLTDRGYDMSGLSDVYERFSRHELPSDDFNLRGSAVNPTTHKRIAYVAIFASEKSTYTQQAPVIDTEREFLPLLKPTERAEDHPDRVHSLLFILDKPLQRTTYNDFNRNTEAFKIDDLLYNVTKHALVPKHRILTSLEKTILLRITNIQEEDMHGMHVHDPVARYYGARLGDVFFIQRFETENTGIVRSRAELRIVRFVSEPKAHETVPPPLVKQRNYHKTEGESIEKWKSSRARNLTKLRRVPELDNEYDY